MTSLGIFLAIVLLMSSISFIAYGYDKHQAIHKGRRIPEQTLHLIDALGGWPGGLLGQKVFRHKTRKLSFQIMFWITVVLHLILTFVAGPQIVAALAA